ncbi:MAG: universal stress protein [Flavobacteriales bacterium]|nr:universal stress protein [Flavobacteriales bacterium]
MANILIPIDFSANALNAAEHALRLFGLEGNQFILVHAYLDPNMLDATLPSMNEALRSSAEEGMALFQKELLAKAELQRAQLSTSVRIGTLPNVITDLIEEHAPRCVVMGTQGASGLKATVFGSNAADVLQRSTVPVLTVPQDSTYREPKRILLADDGAPVRPSAMAILIDLARWSKAEIMIVRVMEEGNEMDPLASGTSYDDLLGAIPHTHHPVSGENVATAINDLADQSDVDMVVVVHRHLGFFGSLFHSSSSKRMAMHTHVPLLVLEQ